MKKKWYGILISIVITLSIVLTACGSSGTPQNDTNPTATSDGDKGSNATEPVTLSVFINMDWYWVDSFGGRPVDEEITKRTGVTLKVTKAADENQLPILIASGDLPDIVYNGSKKVEADLVKQCVSFNELIEKYAPDFKVEDIIIKNNTMEDGKFYTIKNAYATPEEYAEKNPRFVGLPGAATLHLRQDIMEQIGNPAINSLDDFKNVLGMVKEKFPNMNALALRADYRSDYFKQVFGVKSGSTGVYEENGKILYQVRDPKYVETYKYMNELYRSGYISSESLVYKVEDFQQDVFSGNAFSCVAATDQTGKSNEAFKKANSNYKLKILSNVLSEDYSVVSDGIGWAGPYITKNSTKQDKAIKFIQFLRSDEGQKLACWGIEGEHYTLSSDGYPDLTPKMVELKNDYDNMVRTVGNMAWAWVISSKTEGVWNYNPHDQELTDWLTVVKNNYAFKPLHALVIPNGDIDESVIYKKVVDYEKVNSVKLIAAKSEAEFDSAYNDMLNKLEAMGLSKLEAWMTQKYEAIK